MANELLTREDIVRAKQNVDAHDRYLDAGADELVTLPSGKVIKTRAGVEKEIREKFPQNTVGLKLTGTARGQVPLAEDIFTAANIYTKDYIRVKTHPSVSCDDFTGGTRYLVDEDVPGAPARGLGHAAFVIDTIISFSANSSLIQIAWGYQTPAMYMRCFDKNFEGWTDWQHSSSSVEAYTTTTATAANVVVSSTGELQRSTSSRLFKTDINEIEIPDYRAALRAVQPISYRSTSATADRTDWHWYSFIAEDLANVDPALVNMSNVEFFEDTDKDGNTFINTRKLPEGEYVPDGLNLNGIVTLMARINQYMLEDIEELEKEKTQLKTRMTKLENRLADLEKLLPAS